MRIYDHFRHLLRNVGIKGMYFDDGVKKFLTEGQVRKFVTVAGFREIEIRKIVILPWMVMDPLNSILEKTWLRHLGLFILMSARK